MLRGGQDEQRFARAAVFGSLLALVIDVWMLSAGHLSLLRRMGAPGSLLDVQGRAFLDGRLSVDPAGAGIEGFVTNGHTYLYFGPFPTLIRLPVLAVTHALDGRLTQLSMLAAFVVLLWAGGRLHWRVRALLRPGAEVGRTDQAFALLLQLSLGAGAIPLYLASWAAVYHEVELWGAALTVAALSTLAGFLRRPSVGRAAWAGVLTLLAVNTRLTVGMAAVAALLVVAAGLGAGMLADRLGGGGRGARLLRFLASFGAVAPAAGGLPESAPAPERPEATAPTDGRRGRLVAALVAAALIPLALATAINQAKFDQPFGLPLDRQVLSAIDPGRRAVLAANDGSLFGAQFVPTTLLQYARPDAVGTSRGFPFVGLPATPPHVVGDVRFDTLEPSLSAPTSMALLCLLTLVAFAVLLAGAERRRTRPLLGMLVASLAGFVTTLTIGYVTTRYLADVLPFLFLGAVIGGQALIARACARSKAARGWLVGGTAALVLVGIVINGGAGLTSQRLLYPGVPDADRAAFVQTQNGWDDFLGRTPHGVRFGPALPQAPTGAPGDLFVVGNCAGLYAAPLTGPWIPVERTPQTGLFPTAAWFPTTTAGRWQTLLTAGIGRARVSVVVRGTPAAMTFGVRIGDGPVRAGRAVAVPDGGTAPHRAPTGRSVRVTLTIEPVLGASTAVVTVTGRQAAVAPAAPPLNSAVTLGTSPDEPAATRFTGAVTLLPTPTPACRQLSRQSGRAY